jgi:phosphate transport system permease protein
VTSIEVSRALPANGVGGGAPAGPTARPAVVAGRARARRRHLIDRVAALLVRAGGLAIIGSILAILLFIVAQVLPLLSAATVETAAVVPLEAGNVRALIADDYGSDVAALDLSGTVRVVRLRDDAIVAEASILPPDAAGASLAAVAVPPRTNLFTAATTTGGVVIGGMKWRTSYEGEARVSMPEIAAPMVVSIDPERRPLRAFAVGGRLDGDQSIAAQRADGTLVIVQRSVSTNDFTGEVSQQEERRSTAVPVMLTHLIFDRDQRNLFAASDSGELLWWTLTPGALNPPQIVPVAGTPITALTMLIGGRSLVVGQANGVLSVWFAVPQPEGGTRLTRIRDFPPLPTAVRAIVPSQRDKGFLAQAADGSLGLYYSTSHRVLWTGRSPVTATALALAPKGTAAYLAGDQRLAVLRIDNPHPEVSLWSLFGRVWYESYDQPEYVWQSSSGTDEFEPKYSLTPLLVGTLKGTLYSLLIAIPLAVFGAMYLSQFMDPRVKGVIKPVIETMAALPSVVLGFLAGLWLAPRVERMFPALLSMMVLVPLLTILTGALWERIPRRMRARLPVGSEIAVFVPVLAGGLWLSMALSGTIELWLFGGNFQAWLLDTTGLPYDQRNAIVVGLAMGFAVIPIIFAIAEDAFSNVPRDLVSGSLALGANRWQTVTRIVLPTASPGIFSAIMVGFGRAVGETMIVLMATGNTPILDWNPFNGFRTLSANIAVEIPEAPQFGTLFRVLFLAALLLFAVTFTVNTAAELVRQRLRQRYARL